MCKTPLCLAALIAALLFAPGCDQQTAQYNTAQEQLDRALELYAAAQQGYAPVSNGQPGSLQAYRQAQMASAIDELQNVINTGSPQQKATAARLLADIHLSAARYATRDALAEYAALAARTPVLEASLQAAERASAQVQRSDVDYDEALARLAGDVNTLDQQRSELSQQAQTLLGQIDQHRAAQTEQRTIAQQQMAQAQAAGQQAFIATGDKQAEYQQAADAAERRAGEASAAAEKRQVQIDLLQRRLDVVNRQLETIQSQIANLQQQTEQTRRLQADTDRAVTAANEQMQQQARELSGEFEALSAIYNQTVMPTLSNAADRAASAVDLLAGAAAQDKLSARLDQVHVNTERAIVAGSWSAVLDMVATIAEQAGLPDAKRYREAQQQAATQRARAVEAAQEAIGAARELVDSLGDAASVQAAQLDRYAQHLGALTDAG